MLHKKAKKFTGINLLIGNALTYNNKILNSAWRRRFTIGKNNAGTSVKKIPHRGVDAFNTDIEWLLSELPR